MATIKSYTDLEQSKKLAEILPIETADMFLFIHGNNSYTVGFGYKKDTAEFYSKTGFEYIPCWSLVGLLNSLPICERKGYQKSKPQLLYNTFVNKWIVFSHVYTTDAYDNQIDACVDMILKLHELKML